ncbi:MAG: LLM class flavin-dependent oxidoreductase [Saprospiraceae bacterium]|nr:LLM class flavin-dependent oxidoreductase [Saprospiraceae bacterium]
METTPNTPIEIRSKEIDGAEVAWFAPICNGDDRFLGFHEDRYRSSWENASSIVLKADRLGYRNILLPSSYQVGQDTLTFAAGLAPLTKDISLLTAIRSGEVHPPMLARAIATLDHMLKGRLTLNIISSNLPGTNLNSADRYQRSNEVIQILKQAWTKERIAFDGQFYAFDLDAQPTKPYQQNGGPLLYFGGYSSAGLDLCAQHCDVYLMWPETIGNLRSLMQTMSLKALGHGRSVDFGLRIHVIVRKTESLAREAARELMQHIEPDKGASIRNRALDAKSLGVARQSEMRALSDSEGFVEDLLWTGIGRARSGCGAALVGDPDQVLAKIRSYIKMGIRSFIFSGYPHLEECQVFARDVLPYIKNVSLSKVQGRIPHHIPATPLGNGKRS